MTYKLNQGISKIISSVLLIFPDGTRREYKCGEQVVNEVFNQKYVISTIRSINDAVELKLVEQEAPIMNWNGEGAISFF